MPNRKRHIAIICGLLGTACLVQGVLIARATVPALDAVRFIESAQNINRLGLTPAISNGTEQPLFPISTWLVQEGLRITIGEFRSIWAVAAQLAAAIPLVLAVVPVYLIALRLAGPRAAWAGSLVFCVLPEVARLGADAISDSTHLLFLCLAFWATVEFIRQREPESQASGSPWWLFAAGAATGTAALARVEVLVLPAALLGTLVVFQLTAGRRRRWPQLAAAVGCLLLGFTATFAPYLVAVEASTPRAIAARVLGRGETAAETPTIPSTATSTSNMPCLDDGRPLSLAPLQSTVSPRRRGTAAAFWSFAEELAEAYSYWVGAFALLGLWLTRDNASRPEARLLQVYGLVFFIAAIGFSASVGYLSARHLLALVAPTIGFAGVGMLAAGSRLSETLDTRRLAGVLARRVDQPARNSPAIAVYKTRQSPAILGLALAGCLVAQVEPLHSGRSAHREAGQWLAIEADKRDAVLDTRGWTGLYSGRLTYQFRDAAAALADPRLAYVTLERRELDDQSDRGHSVRRLLEAAAEPVAMFSPADGEDSSGRSVLVYRWSVDRFARWRERSAPGVETKEVPHVATRRRISPDRG